MFVTFPPATDLRITDLRRTPDIVGRVRRAANLWKRFAAIVVRGTPAGGTMGGPPVEQAPAVGVPAAGRTQPFKEAVLRRITIHMLIPKSQATGKHNDQECPDP